MCCTVYPLSAWCATIFVVCDVGNVPVAVTVITALDFKEDVAKVFGGLNEVTRFDAFRVLSSFEDHCAAFLCVCAYYTLKNARSQQL